MTVHSSAMYSILTNTGTNTSTSCSNNGAAFDGCVDLATAEPILGMVLISSLRSVPIVLAQTTITNALAGDNPAFDITSITTYTFIIDEEPTAIPVPGVDWLLGSALAGLVAWWVSVVVAVSNS